MSETIAATNTRAHDNASPPRTGVGKPARLVFLAYIVCVAIAIVIQDHTASLPLGLFNKGKHFYDLCSDLSLTLCVTLVATFAIELARGRENAIGRLGRGAIGFFLIVELLLYFLDVRWVSRSPNSRLGGPYYEVRSVDGEWVILRKKGAASKEYSTSSMFGFRFPQYSPLRSKTPRVLFLGDSYTEGSGSEAACNYPTVVERTLVRGLGRSVEVMNAGVAGYGPADAARLLRFLDAKGFAFAAIVYNLYLGNDFTDNLPGTERRVVAGMLFRFPLSPFLSIFHPLNSRSFRFALFAKAAPGWNNPHEGGGPAAVGDRDRLNQEFLADMEEKLELNYAVDGPGVATGVVRGAIESMRTDAQRLGIPFVVVVFPDRIEASRDLRVALDTGRRPHLYDLSRLQRWVSAALRPIPTIQMTELLAGQDAFFLPNETHLNDFGNVRAGEFVGQRLAEMLGSSASFGAGAKSGELSVSRPGATSGVCSEPGTTR